MVTCDKCGRSGAVMTTLKRQADLVTLCDKCWREMMRDFPSLIRRLSGKAESESADVLIPVPRAYAITCALFLLGRVSGGFLRIGLVEADEGDQGDREEENRAAAILANLGLTEAEAFAEWRRDNPAGSIEAVLRKRAKGRKRP